MTTKKSPFKPSDGNRDAAPDRTEEKPKAAGDFVQRMIHGDFSSASYERDQNAPHLLGAQGAFERGLIVTDEVKAGFIDLANTVKHQDPAVAPVQHNVPPPEP